MAVILSAVEEKMSWTRPKEEMEWLRKYFADLSQKDRESDSFATLAAGYIGLTSSAHKDSVFLMELKECSKRIYEIPKFIFYALGYAMERVLSMSQTGISAFIPTKVKSQQINLFEYFKIGDCECSTF